jgi:hypothetical protein
LPFEQITFEDAGRYKLRIDYENCLGIPDVVFTDEIEFNVFDETKLISENTDVRGFEGGILTLKVDVVTPGSSPNVPNKYQ